MTESEQVKNIAYNQSLSWKILALTTNGLKNIIRHFYITKILNKNLRVQNGISKQSKQKRRNFI